MSEFDDLIWRHLDGDLDDAGAQRLRAWLAESPGNMRVFLEAAQLHAELPMAARAVNVATPAGAPQASYRCHPLAIAAGIALLASLGVFWFSQDRVAGMSVALDGLHGVVEVVRDGRVLSARDGTNLRSGDEVRTGADGRVRIAWAGEATWLRIGANSALRVNDERGGKQLFLERGGVEAQVAKQAPGRPMRVRTAHGHVEVIGTRFTVDAAETAMRVAVAKGRVRLASNTTSEMIETFQSGSLDAQGQLKVAHMTTAELTSAGLYAHWPLDEARGTRAHDDSGNEHDATISNPDWITEPGVTALAFSRTGLAASDKRGALITPELHLPPQFTIALRVRCDSRSPRSQVVFTNAPVRDDAPGFALLINYNRPGSPPLGSAEMQSLYFRTGDGQRSTQITSAPQALETGRSHSLIVRVDQTKAVMDLLVDGRALLTQSPIAPEFARTGALWFGASPSASLPLAGSLRDIRIFERLLDADEIAHLHRE